MSSIPVRNTENSVERPNRLVSSKLTAIDKDILESFTTNKTVAEGVSLAELIYKLGLAEQLDKSELDGIYSSQYAQVVEKDANPIE